MPVRRCRSGIMQRGHHAEGALCRGGVTCGATHMEVCSTALLPPTIVAVTVDDKTAKPQGNRVRLNQSNSSLAQSANGANFVEAWTRATAAWLRAAAAGKLTRPESEQQQPGPEQQKQVNRAAPNGRKPDVTDHKDVW